MEKNVYTKSFLEGILPDPELWLDEWADRYRVLDTKSSSEAGRWRTDRTPYLRGVMRELSPLSPTQRVVFMKSSQVGGTECGFNWLGFIIHMTPAPILMVNPSLDLAEKISKQRIQPMIDNTPELKKRIAPARERDSGNTMFIKEFQGGLLVLAGANSATSLRSMPIRFLYCTEVSSYPHDVGGEGDPVNLAEKRTQTFARRKIFLESTPAIKDTCRIESEFLKSDQRRYYVPCPFCSQKQYLKFPQLKWNDDERLDVRYKCEYCGELIPEFKKTEMLENGEWIATAEGDGVTVGFHINALYSPVGWKSWNEIVREFLQAKNDAPLLKTWVNTVLGETFDEDYSNKLGTDNLRSRAEKYPFEAPDGVLCVTVGIDVQDNRVAVGHWGWGRGEESWVLSYQEIMGDPSSPALWRQVDEVLFQEFKTSWGSIVPMAAAIDSGGHHTHTVYNYARERTKKNVIAIKGQSQKGKPALGKPSKVDLNIRGQFLKNGALVYPVGSDTIKTIIYSRLKHNQGGEGYMHFHDELSDEFYEMLVAEKQLTRFVKGFPVRDWVLKSGQRNESLDCAVYSYAALQFVMTKYNRKTFWEQMDKIKTSPRGSGILPKPNAQSNMGIMQKKKSFVTGF